MSLSSITESLLSTIKSYLRDQSRLRGLDSTEIFDSIKKELKVDIGVAVLAAYETGLDQGKEESVRIKAKLEELIKAMEYKPLVNSKLD